MPEKKEGKKKIMKRFYSCILIVISKNELVGVDKPEKCFIDKILLIASHILLLFDLKLYE